MKNNILIALFGHIDHGKTSLIKALNGFDGDSKEEEIKRGLTLELSYSKLENKDKNIIIIDAPGHKNLIKQAIFGAYGIDYAVIVIDINEGLKEQSKEHLEILKHLAKLDIIVCFSKFSGDKKEFEDILEFIKNLGFNILNYFFTDINDEILISNLRNFLLALVPKAKDQNYLWLYVNKVFSINGKGDILNATLISKYVTSKDFLFNPYANKFLKIKSLEFLKKEEDKVIAPARVGINFSNSKVCVGDILTDYKILRSTLKIDCYYEGDINHNDEVILVIGAKSIVAKFLKISSKFGSFKLKDKLFCKFFDRFVLLKNARVIGGGIILNMINEPFIKYIIDDLYNKNFLNVFEKLSSLHKFGFGLISSFQRFNLNTSEAIKIATNLKDVFIDKKNSCIYKLSSLDIVKRSILNLINKNKNAIISSNLINLRLNWASKDFINLALLELEGEKKIVKKQSFFIASGIDLDILLKELKNQIFTHLDSITPKNINEISKILDIDRIKLDEILSTFLSTKKVIKLNGNIFISSNKLNYIISLLREDLLDNKKIDVSYVKNKFQISRKYAISYLEFLDQFDDISNLNFIRSIKR